MCLLVDGNVSESHWHDIKYVKEFEMSEHVVHFQLKSVMRGRRRTTFQTFPIANRRKISFTSRHHLGSVGTLTDEKWNQL